MQRAKTLNLIDIFKFKKDLCWGKKYFALVDNGKLESSLLYSKYCKAPKVLEILSSENSNKELISEFIKSRSQKGCKYFLRELDEKIEIEEIKIMHEVGFKRLSRNYYYEYQEDKEKKFSNEGKSSVNILCKEANISTIEHIMDIELSAQLLEYRDHFYKHESFFMDSIDELFIFLDGHGKIYGFANKKLNHLDETFEFTVLRNLSNLLPSCIEAFEEIYIKYHKNHIFRFVVNENHQSILNDLNKNYKPIASTQLLIREAQPREKLKIRVPNLIPKAATS